MQLSDDDLGSVIDNSRTVNVSDTGLGGLQVSAIPARIDEGQAVTPSNSQFPSQDGVKKIRADEAWTIARGAVTIAVVDSGADLDHPDLSAKIVKGKDFVDGDNNPDDEHGHGTHVAGIAGAAADNGKGIAGVSWGSKILVVRVLDATNSGTVARDSQPSHSCSNRDHGYAG